MTTSDAGRAFIETFEGLRTTAYMPTPHDVPTIGYGHTLGVKMGDTCTQAEADEMLAEDLRVAELVLETLVEVDLNQNQIDALVSFVFNVGAGNFKSSTLLKLLNQSDFDGAADQFLRWDKQAGVELAGLTKRRAAERSLFLTPAS
jgi:lysozyme